MRHTLNNNKLALADYLSCPGIVDAILFILALLASIVYSHAQFGQGVAAGTWEPLAIRTKAGIVADWNPGMASTYTLNGSQISQITDRSWQAGRLENLLVQSESLNTTWTKVNASISATNSVVDPLGGSTADTITPSNNTGYISQGPYTGDYNGVTFVVSAWMKCISGTKTVKWGCVKGGDVALFTSTNLLTTSWQQLSLTGTVSGATTLVGAFYQSQGDTADFSVWGAQLRRSTSSSTYVATTTVVEDASRNLNQTTAANQPLLSRADNAGNLLVQSETFATTWSRTRINAFGATDTGAAGAGSFANTARTFDPLGGNTSDFIQEDSTAGATHFIQQNALFSAGQYVLSCYVKPSGRDWVRLRLADAATGNNYGQCWFDTQNGTVGTAQSGGTASSVSGSIQVSANGFYRCNLTITLASSELHSALIYTTTADTVTSYNGDNTSGLFIWGASLRPSTWDSTYVATVALPAIAGLNNRTTAYFDGAAYYLKANAFTLNQPTEVYRACNPWTWTLNDAAFDGNATGTGKLYQSATSPKIRFYAGTDGTEFTPPAAGTWRVTSVVFDGNNSRISTNRGAYAVSPAGAGNMGGHTLGANGANTAFWNGQVARQIICNQTNVTAESSFIQWGLLKNSGVL